MKYKKTEFKDTSKSYDFKKPVDILLIPDTQIRPDLFEKPALLKHIKVAGQLIVDRRPDVVVMIGDWWDMEGLSSYDKGKKSAEGKRVNEDIEAGNKAMDMLLKPLRDYNAKQVKLKKKQYKPLLIFCIGNHEQRIERYVSDNPAIVTLLPNI